MTTKKDTTLTGILSFLIPGLGQIYVGKTWRGISWLIFTALGYICFIVPGFIIWIINIWDAIDQAEKYNKGR